ncbi:MAG: hypothetical protein H7X79_02150 [Sporomusaceae bacterium]|nr:hypothetical protein [Sporomusaceae bacterium]
MYKWCRFFLMITLLLLTFPGATSAADVSVGVWHAAGSQQWRTVFPLHTHLVDGASELYYPQSGKYIIASYEKPISPRQSISIEGGIMADLPQSIGSDSDWDTSKSPALWYYGEFKTKAKNHFITVDWKRHATHNTTFFYGYTYNRNYNSMTDGLYTIRDYTAVYSPLPDLNSYYTMSYQGPHVGIIHNAPLTNKITAIGSLSYSPYGLAQGHGWWNLRDLDFRHTGTAQMLETKIGLRFALNQKNSSITLGYRYQSFRLLRGSENLSPDISWVKANHIQQGYYFTTEMKF